MDPRERWQALQAHLTAARAALDTGDKHRALAEVDAALAIDPNFLAALSLRDRALAALPPKSVAPVPIVGAVPIAATPTIAEPLAPPAAPAKRRIVSTAGYAQFEQRAKRRRVDHRLDAVRAAMQSGLLREAAAALDEVSQLDPNLPELSALTVEFDELGRIQSSAHRGPWIAAATVFALTFFGATWLHDTRALLSRATAGAVPLLSAPIPSAAVNASEPGAIATSGAADTSPAQPASVPLEAIEPTARPAEVIAPPEQPAPVPPSPARVAVAEPSPAPRPAPPPVAINQPLLPRAASELLAAAPPSAAPSASSSAPMTAPIASPPAPSVALPIARIDDESLVKQTLQQYRRAYDELDAQSARTVYPAINEAALARAFDGLASQSLTFDTCDVRMNGSGAATATCRGSARYVPKVGSREPHTEPRTWNFTLRKNGSGWQIENARAER